MEMGILKNVNIHIYIYFHVYRRIEYRFIHLLKDQRCRALHLSFFQQPSHYVYQ
jgi:hypothetical protein